MHLSKIGIEAQYMQWQILEKSGLIVKEGEQHNLILDHAKELMATHGMDGITAFAVVGTGSTVPNVSQLALTAEVARTSTVPSGEADSITRFSNGVYDIKRVRQFTVAQVGSQNLTEWGFAPLGSGNLAVRELFRNSGTPITITLTATQTLRIVYVTRVNLLPVIAQNVSVNIAGVGNRSAKLFLLGANDFYTVNSLIKGDAGFGILDNTVAIDYASGFFMGNNPRLNGQFASAYIANSKTRAFGNISYSAPSFTGTVFGFGCRSNSNANAAEHFGLLCQFDTGQEFIKAGTHSLEVAPFGVTWT
jgi:hypothetical protein